MRAVLLLNLFWPTELKWTNMEMIKSLLHRINFFKSDLRWNRICALYEISSCFISWVTYFRWCMLAVQADVRYNVSPQKKNPKILFSTLHTSPRHSNHKPPGQSLAVKHWNMDLVCPCRFYIIFILWSWKSIAHFFYIPLLIKGFG